MGQSGGFAQPARGRSATLSSTPGLVENVQLDSVDEVIRVGARRFDVRAEVFNG